MKSNNYIQCLKQVSNFHLPVFYEKCRELENQARFLKNVELVE